MTKLRIFSPLSPSAAAFRRLAASALFFLLFGAAQALPAAHVERGDAPLSAEELEAFKGAFDEATLKSLFGPDATLAGMAEIDRNSATGPRTYDIYVNERFTERRRITVLEENGRYVAEIPAEVLSALPFDMSNPDIPSAIAELDPKSTLRTDGLNALLPGSTVRLSPVKEELRIVIPPSWFSKRRGNIAPDRIWDWGENAIVANYDLQAGAARTEERTAAHLNLNVNARLNAGAWRVLGGGNFSADNRSGEPSETEFERRELFATRVFPESKTRVKFGEFTTASYFTTATNMRGAEIHVEPDMLDDNSLDFVPVITGTAASEARVTVRQLGRIVYERYVSPGPFTLENLPNIGNSGDLFVTVTEADGTESSYVVPFTTNARQLRRGKSRWSAAVGIYGQAGDALEDKTPLVAAFDGGYGAPFNTTLYGGAVLTDAYYNVRAGLGVMVPGTGALNIEYVRIDDRTEGPSEGLGSGLVLSFTRYVEQTGSHLTLRYERAISGALTSIDEAYGLRDAWGRVPYGAVLEEWQASVSQSMGRFGNLNLSYNRRKREGDNRPDTSLAASYTTSVNRMNLTVAVQKSERHYASGETTDDLTASVNATIPLAVVTGDSIGSQTVGAGLTRTSDGHFDKRLSFSGSALEDNKLTYSLQTTHSGAERDTQVNGSVQYRANRADLRFSANAGPLEKSVTASVNGAVVALKDGVFLTKEADGPTVFAEIVDVPEAQLQNRARSTSVSGGVFSTGLRNYESNELALAVNDLPPNVYLPLYTKRVVPADDAVLKVTFDAFRGEQLLVNFVTEDGPPPFGSFVRLVSRPDIGAESMLDETGTAYFAAVPEKGEFEVSWRDETSTKLACRAPYALTAKKDDAMIYKVELACRPTPQPEANTAASITTILPKP